MNRWVKQPVVFCLVWYLPISAALVGGDRSPTGKASIRGRVTTRFQNRIIPVGKLTVYLFTLEQSRSLQHLQRELRNRRSKPGMTDVEKGQMAVSYLDSAVRLVPQLKAMAVVETNGKGVYRFDGVPAGRSYQVVGLLRQEDGDIFVQHVTPLLNSGEVFHLDMDDTDDADWTDLTPAPR